MSNIFRITLVPFLAIILLSVTTEILAQQENPFAFLGNNLNASLSQFQQEEAAADKKPDQQNQPNVFNPFVNLQNHSHSQTHHSHYNCESIPSPCGIGANCQMVNARPECSCPETLTGDPNVRCSELPSLCYPSPCGEAAICSVKDGIVTCTCPEPLKGNPLVRCIPVPSACDPPPCGPNAQCTTGDNDKAICSCLPNYIGPPPNCRPECLKSSDCTALQICRQLKCVDI